MSRIGKQKIVVASNIQASVGRDAEGAQTLKIKGPSGELSRVFRPEIEIKIENGEIVLTPKEETLFINALWGTYASHILNMIEGVTKGFKKVLVIEGIGFKTVVQGEKMVFNLGFSHQVEMPIPKGIKVVVEKSNIIVTGIDKEQVGQFCAKVVELKKPEPYKGKGIKYEGQVIKLKQGKKTIA